MKTIKWIIIVAATCATLFFGAILFITSAMDPNDYTGKVSQLVKKETDLDIKLGFVDWSFFPWLGISVDSLQLAHPKAGELAKIGQVQVRVKVLPLLKRQLEIGTLKVISADLRVISNKDGALNWDVLTAQEVVSETPATETNAQPLPVDISVQNIEVSNTVVRYTDLSTNAKYLLSDFNLAANTVTLGEPFPINMNFKADLGDGILIKQTLDAAATIDLEKEKYSLNTIDYQAVVTADALLRDSLTISLTASAFANLITDRAQLSDLVVKADAMSLTGIINVSQLTGELSLEGSLNVAQFNPKSLLKKLRIELPPMAEPSTLSSVAFSTNLSGGLTQFKADTLKLTIDSTNITGTVGISDLETQAMYTTLLVDQINIDNYLPLSDELAVDKVPELEAETDSESLIPVDTLKDLKLNAQLTIKELTAHTIPLTDISVDFSANNGVVDLSKLSANTLGGSLQLTARLDAKSSPPTIAVTNELNRLQLAPLVQAFADSDLFSGEVNFNGKLTTKGNSIDAFTRNLSGLNNFSMTNGVLKGVNITELAFDKLGALGPIVEGYLAKENSVKAPPAFKKDSTIGNLVAAIDIVNGVATTQNMSMKLEKAKASGKGQVDLVKSALSIDLNVQLDESISNAHISDIQWPIHCEGSLSAAPSCSVDSGPARDKLQSLAKDSAKEKVRAKLAKKLGVESSEASINEALNLKREAEKRRLREKEDAIKQKAKDKINEKLKNLFN